MNWVYSAWSTWFGGRDSQNDTTKRTPQSAHQGKSLCENPVNAAPRVNQGLEWANRSLKRDADGDEAHEFIVCD